MSPGRPRIAIGTFGEIAVIGLGGRYRAITRYRDLDGRLRRVTATARSPRAAQAELHVRLLGRPGHSTGGTLGPSSGFRQDQPKTDASNRRIRCPSSRRRSSAGASRTWTAPAQR